MKVGKGQKYYSYGNHYYPYNEKYEAQSDSGRCRYPNDTPTRAMRLATTRILLRWANTMMIPPKNCTTDSKDVGGDGP